MRTILKVRVPLHRLVGNADMDGVMLLEKEPLETWSRFKTNVIPLSQAVEIEVDALSSGYMEDTF